MYIELKYNDKIKIIHKDDIRYISYYITDFGTANIDDRYNIDINLSGGHTCYISSNNEEEILSLLKKLKENLCIE